MTGEKAPHHRFQGVVVFPIESYSTALSDFIHHGLSQ